MSTVRWGIVGPGRIAHKFAYDLGVVKSARLHAVASRSPERGERFAAQYGCHRVYDSYQQLAADDEIDAVYVATPHSHHLAAARTSLEAGRAVLVEKPMAATAEQVEEMIALASASGSFLMEALWTRFLPIMTVIQRWVAQGAIGKVRLVRASFGYGEPKDGEPRPRLRDPALAGGSVLDVGIYALSFARWLFEAPALETHAVGSLGASGVDEACSIVQRFPGGGLAELSCAVAVETDRQALIVGSEGQIEVPLFYGAEEATLQRGGERLHVKRSFESGGFEYQIRAVGRCLGAGLLESPQIPLAESLETAHVMDSIRRQIGVVYPFE